MSTELTLAHKKNSYELVISEFSKFPLILLEVRFVQPICPFSPGI